MSTEKKKGGEAYVAVSSDEKRSFTIDDDDEEIVEAEAALQDDNDVSPSRKASTEMTTEPITRGVVQTPAYRDKYFALAFLIQLLLVLLVACIWGFPMYNNASSTLDKLEDMDEGDRVMRRMKDGGNDAFNRGGGFDDDSLNLPPSMANHNTAGTGGGKENVNYSISEKGNIDVKVTFNDKDTNEETVTFNYDDTTGTVREEEHKGGYNIEDEYDNDDDDTFDNDVFDPNKQDSSSSDFTKTMTVFATQFLPTIIVISIIVSPLLSFAALYLMMNHAKTLLQASLLLSVVINVLLFLITLISGSQAAFTYLTLSIIFAWYAKVVWNRVTYAASTLKCAVTAVKANFGVALLALGAIPVSAGWVFFWVTSIVGSLSWGCMYTTVTRTTTNSSFGDDGFSSSTTSKESTAFSGLGVFIMSLFILSYYWTSQVIKNSVRTTVAGVIGTWWFNPSEASSFCSSAVRDSFLRANTYSLGSIAFGSLIVAIIQFVKNTVASGRNRHHGMVSLCLHCILVYIEKLANYFHKWAFVYVGLYGYGYLEAGKSVMALFQQRGFTAIISDNIVHRMLIMIGLCIGLMVGTICALAGWMFGAVEGTGIDGEVALWANVSLFTGLIIGAILSSIVMGVVGNSVDAIIVCYAEAPADFKTNHPALHDEMEESWSSMTSTSTMVQAAAISVALDMETGVV